MPQLSCCGAKEVPGPVLGMCRRSGMHKTGSERRYDCRNHHSWQDHLHSQGPTDNFHASTNVPNPKHALEA